LGEKKLQIKYSLFTLETEENLSLKSILEDIDKEYYLLYHFPDTLIPSRLMARDFCLKEWIAKKYI